MLKAHGKQMGVQMVDPKKGLAKPKSQTLGKGHAHKQAAKQPRPTRGRHKVDIRIGFATALHQLVKQCANKTVVLTRGKLWHYPAKQGMHVSLASQHGFNQPAVFHQCQRGFIARTFNSKAQHAFRH